MKKTFWTVVGLVLSGVALFPMVSHAGIRLTNHNETLVRAK